MHPNTTYELARIRIEEFHREAHQDRLAQTARRANREAALQVSDGLHRPQGLLQRLLARLAPAASGA